LNNLNCDVAILSFFFKDVVFWNERVESTSSSCFSSQRPAKNGRAFFTLERERTRKRLKPKKAQKIFPSALLAVIISTNLEQKLVLRSLLVLTEKMFFKIVRTMHFDICYVCVQLC
jgi:hypothetical protein